MPDQPLRRPPPTRAGDQVDDYHGTAIGDPYRWLEDPDSPETQAWVTAQNEVTFGYLASLPERESFRRRLTELQDYERFSVPYFRGGRYFFARNSGLENQAVLFVQNGLDGVPRVLLDPNLLSPDGTVALTLVEPSPDGRLLLYGTSTSGSDWQEFRIRRVDDGVDLPDRLRWIKFSGGTWTRDGAGFFYGRYPEPSGAALTAANRDMKVYYHRLGAEQADDTLIYQRPDQPDWGFGLEVSHDGRYLIVAIWVGTDTRTRIHYLDLIDPTDPRLSGPVTPMLDRFDAAYAFLGNRGPTCYFRTDLDAPRGRIVSVEATAPEVIRSIVAERPDALESVAHVGGRLVASYLVDAKSALEVFDEAGTHLGALQLPGIGTGTGITGEPDRAEAFFAFTSFLAPATIYRADVVARTVEVFRAPVLKFDPTAFTTEQVFYRSKDGTRIPMFLVHRADLKRDGTNPTLLYGYGGFDVSLTPAFSPGTIAWIERGGIYASANLRGGGEYGKAWHEAGQRGSKQNVFDDFIAAAEHLIAEGYTSSAHLAVEGGSNGGLLVGATVNQRPDLAAVAIPEVGVLDMLRYHHFTIGWAWVPEYGSAEDRNDFPVLRGYSPLHNLVPGTDYPATLIVTADHDDRVVPAHSFKYAAALQAATAWQRPAYIRIETKAGHGAGKPLSKSIEERADVLAFAWAHLDRREPCGGNPS
ncbi:MAG: S9 family peptidase [Gemmatimonadetes bacterium]|nr:S9 family peptidase [Gemmatimonadota bacterium]